MSQLSFPSPEEFLELVQQFPATKEGRKSLHAVLRVLKNALQHSDAPESRKITSAEASRILSVPSGRVLLERLGFRSASAESGQETWETAALPDQSITTVFMSTVTKRLDTIAPDVVDDTDEESGDGEEGTAESADGGTASSHEGSPDAEDNDAIPPFPDVRVSDILPQMPKFVHDFLTTYDWLLRKIALVARRPVDQAKYAKATLHGYLVIFQKQNWRMVKAAEKLWAGERDFKSLVADADPNSALLIRQIMEYFYDPLCLDRERPNLHMPSYLAKWDYAIRVIAFLAHHPGDNNQEMRRELHEELLYRLDEDQFHMNEAVDMLLRGERNVDDVVAKSDMYEEEFLRRVLDAIDAMDPSAPPPDRPYGGVRGGRGVMREDLNMLPTRTFHMTPHLSDDKKQCAICFVEFDDGDELRALPCFHTYHIACVDRWLRVNATCPVCKAKVGRQDERREERIPAEEFFTDLLREIASLAVAHARGDESAEYRRRVDVLMKLRLPPMEKNHWELTVPVSCILEGMRDSETLTSEIEYDTGRLVHRILVMIAQEEGSPAPPPFPTREDILRRARGGSSTSADATSAAAARAEEEAALQQAIALSLAESQEHEREAERARREAELYAAPAASQQAGPAPAAGSAAGTPPAAGRSPAPAVPAAAKAAPAPAPAVARVAPPTIEIPPTPREAETVIGVTMPSPKSEVRASSGSGAVAGAVAGGVAGKDGVKETVAASASTPKAVSGPSDAKPVAESSSGLPKWVPYAAGGAAAVVAVCLVARYLARARSRK